MVKIFVVSTCESFAEQKRIDVKIKVKQGKIETV